MIWMFKYLKTQKSVNEEYYKILDSEAKNIISDAKSVIDNKADLEKINAIKKQLNLEF